MGFGFCNAPLSQHNKCMGLYVALSHHAAAFRHWTASSYWTRSGGPWSAQATPERLPCSDTCNCRNDLGYQGARARGECATAGTHVRTGRADLGERRGSCRRCRPSGAQGAARFQGGWQPHGRAARCISARIAFMTPFSIETLFFYDTRTLVIWRACIKILFLWNAAPRDR